MPEHLKRAKRKVKILKHDLTVQVVEKSFGNTTPMTLITVIIVGKWGLMHEQ